MPLALGRTADLEAQVGDSGPLDDLRVVEEQRSVRELASCPLTQAERLPFCGTINSILVVASLNCPPPAGQARHASDLSI